MSQRLLLATLLGICSLSAQDFRATLQGTITDPSDATIAAATVTLKNTETGVERRSEADTSGHYLFQFLPVGNYVLTASASGFKTSVREGIRLDLGANLRVDVQLPLGETTESVSVVAELLSVQTDSTDLSTTVTPAIIDNLPMKGRSSLFMFTLAPGVVTNRYWEDTRPNDTATNVSFASNGSPTTSTDVSVDGAINTVNVNRGLNISSWVPAMESVQDFKVETGILPAEYGRSAGTIMNVVIKSGTNELHGSLYYFHQNSALNANNFFSRGRAQDLTPFASNNWGEAIGGPIYFPKLYDGRNRTFWFFNHESSREGNGAGTTSSVPTAKMLTGDFSEVGSPLYDPFSVQTVSGVPTRSPFPGNMIPASRQDPVAANIMEYWPAPNTPSSSASQPWVQNFTFSYKWPRNFDMYVIKLDHVFSEKWNTFFRSNWGSGFFNFPYDFDGIATPGRNVVRRPHKGFTWGNNVLISPRTTMDLRVGVTIGKDLNSPWSDGFDITSLGFPPSLESLVQSLAFPTIRVTGFQGLAGSNVATSVGTTPSLQASISMSRGKHLLKTGADIRLIYGNYFSNGQPSGSFSFNSGWTGGPRADTPGSSTGFSMASFLLGLGGGSIDTNTAVSIINKFFGFYLQDDYRVTRKLTLNLGIRYEYETPRTERYDRTTRGFAYDAASPLQVPGLDLRGGLLYAGVGGNPRGIYDPDRNNIAPRIGLAYSVNPKTVVRTGYALYHIPVVQSVDPTGFSVTTPFVASQDGITPKDRLGDPFPDGLLEPIGSSQGLATLVGQSVDFIEPGDRTPMFHTWMLNIQRTVTSGVVVQAGYVGSRGISLVSGGSWSSGESERVNQAHPSYLELGNALLERVPNPFYGILESGSLAGPTLQRGQLLRPYPQFTGVTRNFPAYGSSVYHAFQAKLETRLRSWTTIVSYTASKNLSDIATIQNAYDRRAARSPAAFDVPQRLTITTSIDLPFGQGRRFLGQAPRALDLIAGGWTLAFFNTFQGGFPQQFSVGRSTLFLPGSGPQFPNAVGDPSEGISGPHSQRLNRYFNTDAFAQPPDFTFGNTAARIGSVRSPGMDNWNLSLTKQFSITERFKVNLRASSFNLLNHPVFSAPNTQFGTGNFGRIFSQANAPRQTELALKLLF